MAFEQRSEGFSTRDVPDKKKIIKGKVQYQLSHIDNPKLETLLKKLEQNYSRTAMLELLSIKHVNPSKPLQKLLKST